uniref:Uncharacterized protein n=1 Tax=Rhizophagus irregularis (strain DAOM 181602 / DAOM 197198 / MUCL 43194) TaxID=747089 RepID=U9U6E4_RHIID
MDMQLSILFIKPFLYMQTSCATVSIKTDPQFFRDVQRQGKYPFLIHPNISNANTPDITIDNLSELTSNIFKDEQEMLENRQWIQAVDNGFNGIIKIIKDVKTYRNRTTNPRTWKDHNNTTMFLGPVNIFKLIV